MRFWDKFPGKSNFENALKKQRFQPKSVIFTAFFYYSGGFCRNLRLLTEIFCENLAAQIDFALCNNRRMYRSDLLAAKIPFFKSLATFAPPQTGAGDCAGADLTACTHRGFYGETSVKQVAFFLRKV